MRIASMSTTSAGLGLTVLVFCACAAGPACGQGPRLADLDRLESGRTRAENALWIENPLEFPIQHIEARGRGRPQGTRRDHDDSFRGARKPGQRADPPARSRPCAPDVLGWGNHSQCERAARGFLLRSSGLGEEVNTALVNKRRGFNCYFPMPFRISARIELLYEGPVPPGEALWRIMPCYSYVMYRHLDQVSDDRGYFHAAWRQEALLLGQRDYVALEAKGRGKFIGWNATVRLPGRPGYPVDQNEKFFIDGETQPSVEFQGMEDSFGFSWGFPPTESQFSFTGYYPFYKGAAAYRFFTADAISFEKSLQVTIGFGEHEDPMFRREFSRRGNTLQFSTTVYWYQLEPHVPLPPLPAATERAPAPNSRSGPTRS